MNPKYSLRNLTKAGKTGGRAVFPLLISFLLGVLIWELAVRWGGIGRFLLPAPRDVLQVLWTRSQDLLAASWLTFRTAFSGFLISVVVGLGVAIGFAESGWLRRALYPYAILLHTVPIIAISPLVITWFGTGTLSVVVITFIVSLFPIITGTTNGLLQSAHELQELFQLYQASRWQTLWKLKFPSAVPQIVTGIQTASGLAIVGAIVGEFFAGQEAEQYGLGHYISVAQGQFRTDILIASVILSTGLGILLFGLVTLISRTALNRWMIR